MKLRLTLVFALAFLLVGATSLTAAGGNEAMSPVGAWASYFEPDPDSPGEPNITMGTLERGGTVSGAAWTDPWTNTVGAWKKVAGNTYLSTFYVMLPEAGGILKIIDEFRMLSKDEGEGRQEAWWVPGPDPLGDPVARLWWGSTSYQRIRPEPPPLP